LARLFPRYTFTLFTSFLATLLTSLLLAVFVLVPLPLVLFLHSFLLFPFASAALALFRCWQFRFGRFLLRLGR